jgi:hypothetical protein
MQPGEIAAWADEVGAKGNGGAHGTPDTTTRCGPLSYAAFDVGPYEVPTYEDSSIRLDVLATDGSSYRVRVTKK